MEKNINTGIVYRRTVGSYSVHTDGRVVECAVSAKLKLQLDSSKPVTVSRKRSALKVKRKVRTDPVAVGDMVQFVDSQDGSGMIVEVLSRRNQLSRRSSVPMPSAQPYEQVIVANIDQVVPVFAVAQPNPTWYLLDRYLVTAEAGSLPVLICITKIDLVQDRNGCFDRAFHETLQIYRDIGYPVILTSARTKEGFDRFIRNLQGMVSVFLGKSGVGKTSLLNALQPGMNLPVGEVIQATGKGKHVTTHLEMYDLEFGGAVIDTPGIREFGLWGVDELDLVYCFPEMRPYIGQCKFGMDCRHDQEPDCEIRKAVLNGEISPYRYQSYMRLMVEVC